VSDPKVEDAFPELFTAADRAALQRQRRYLRATSAGLLAALVAAIGSAISVDLTKNLDLGGLISAVGFLTAAVLTGYLYFRKPDQSWYESRAVAESIKSMSWQYAMRGGIFTRDNRADATEFGGRARKMVRRMRHAGVALTGDNDRVTDEMTAVRDAPLAERRKIYLTQRLEDQNRYYLRKSEENRARAARWFGVAILLQACGLVLAWLKVTNRVDADLLGIAATAAAGALAWVQTRDSQSLAESYREAANELADVIGEARAHPDTLTDEEWSRFIRDGEQSISREHTLWLARREPGLTPDDE
jgi:hypothetical protein